MKERQHLEQQIDGGELYNQFRPHAGLVSMGVGRVRCVTEVCWLVLPRGILPRVILPREIHRVSEDCLLMIREIVWTGARRGSVFI